jgi:hypothetical protein
MSELQRYQGREFEVTLQAPNYPSLNAMVKDMEKVARKNGMGEVSVLSKGADPDGGYKAIVVAHNWNPIKWLKRQGEMKDKSYEEKMRLKRAFRREDEAQKNVQHQKKMTQLSRKAEREESKERIEQAKAGKRAYRGSSRLGSQYAYAGAGTGLIRKPNRMSSRSSMPRLSKKMKRLPR